MPHFQHKHLTTLCHHCGLQDQLHSLWNAHEITGDLRVRHGDGATIGQLLPKQRHHAATAAQHIAKAHHAKACALVARLRGQRLQHQLSHALAGTHQVGGAHGFVGRHQHKAACPHRCGRLRHVERSKHIVDKALRRVALHHGHMLVGCSVVHGVWPVSGANPVQPTPVNHRGQQRHQLGLGVCVFAPAVKLAVQGVEGEFAVLQQQQLARMLLQNLSTQFAANAAARPGHQHRFAFYATGQQVCLQNHRIAAKQVVKVEFVHVLHRHFAAGQVRQRGQGAGVHMQRTQGVDDLVALPPRHIWNGQQHIGDVIFLHHLRQLGG